jgi:predicted RNA-binding Zn-ribbon protein involved in translation (DUF1610 family)
VHALYYKGEGKNMTQKSRKEKAVDYRTAWTIEKSEKDAEKKEKVDLPKKRGRGRKWSFYFHHTELPESLLRRSMEKTLMLCPRCGTEMISQKCRGKRSTIYKCPECHYNKTTKT